MTAESRLGLPRALRNAATGYGVRAVLGVSVLLLTPYLYRRLGTGGFGTWSVIWSITAVFTVLEFGGLAGISKHVAQSHGAGRREEVQRTVGSGVTLMAFAGLLAAAVCLVTAWLGDGLAAAGEKDDFRLGLIILAGVALVRLPLMAYDAALVGYQRYDIHNVNWCLNVVVFSVGAVVAVEAGTGVAGVSAAYGLGLLAGGVFAAVMLRRVDPQVSRKPRRLAHGDTGALLGLSSYGALADSMLLLGQRMDTTVIAAIRGSVAAAPYAAAVKVQSAVQSLVLPFAELLMPMLSELWGRGARDLVAQRLVAGTRLTLQVVIPVSVAIALVATDITDVWLGDSGSHVTSDVMAVLVIAQVFWLGSIPADRALIATGRIRAAAVLAVFEGAGNLGLSIVLVHAHGAIGAAVATLIMSALVTPLRIPLACRAVGTSVLGMLDRGIARPVATAVPAIAVMVALRLLMEPGLLRVVAVMVAGLVVQSAIVFAQLGRRRAMDLLMTLRQAGGDAGPASDPAAVAP